MSIFACYAVAVVLLLAGVIPLFTEGVFLDAKFGSYAWLNFFIALPFLARGLGGYLPVLEKRWTRVFVRYNRIIYSPLCIALVLSYILFGSD